MRDKCLPLSTELVILFASPALSIDLTVDTELPDYILEDHIRISGTTNDPVSPLVITSEEDFSRGESTNVTVEDGGDVEAHHLGVAGVQRLWALGRGAKHDDELAQAGRRHLRLEASRVRKDEIGMLH